MKKISITVPMDYFALTRASEMFHRLAQDVVKAIDGAVELTPVITATSLDGENIEADELVLGGETPAVAAKKEIPRTDKPDPKSLDADGIPWDARIHAASQLRVVRGNTWKLIRGVDKDLVEQVKAELLAAQTAAPAVAPGPAGDPTVTPASQAFGNQQEPASAKPIDFAGLAAKITPRVVANPEYNKVIQDVLIEFNVEGGLPVLMGMPELIPQVDARLDALWQG